MKKWKLIIFKGAYGDEEDEEGDDQEETDSSGEEDDQSQYITCPPKYPKKAIQIRKFKCNKCEERFVHLAFLNAHVFFFAI